MANATTISPKSENGGAVPLMSQPQPPPLLSIDTATTKFCTRDLPWLSVIMIETRCVPTCGGVALQLRLPEPSMVRFDGDGCTTVKVNGPSPRAISARDIAPGPLGSYNSPTVVWPHGFD